MIDRLFLQAYGRVEDTARRGNVPTISGVKVPTAAVLSRKRHTPASVPLPTNNSSTAGSTRPDGAAGVPAVLKGEAPVPCHDKLGLLSAGRAVPHEYWKAPFASTAMRKLLLLVLVLGILWALDTFGFNGRYSSAVWLDANDQAHSINYQAHRWVQKLTGG